MYREHIFGILVNAFNQAVIPYAHITPCSYEKEITSSLLFTLSLPPLTPPSLSLQYVCNLTLYLVCAYDTYTIALHFTRVGVNRPVVIVERMCTGILISVLA